MLQGVGAYLKKIVKAVLNVLAGFPRKVGFSQRLTHGSLKYLKTMQLVVAFEQIDALAPIAGKIH